MAPARVLRMSPATSAVRPRLPGGEEAGYRARKCAGCGLVYASPRPRQAQIAEAARTGEHASEHGALSVTGRYRKSRAQQHRRTIEECSVTLQVEPG